MQAARRRRVVHCDYQTANLGQLTMVEGFRSGEPGASVAIDARAYVEWGAIIAGAILASAIAFVLLTFGSAIGLSVTSPFKGEGLAGTVLAVAVAL